MKHSSQLIYVGLLHYSTRSPHTPSRAVLVSVLIVPRESKNSKCNDNGTWPLHLLALVPAANSTALIRKVAPQNCVLLRSAQGMM